MQITASTRTISALTLSLLCIGAAQAAPSITFAGWGGALQDAERKAYLEPAAKALGVTIKEDNMDGLAAVRAQVLSGKPQWDVVELASNDCVLAERQGLTEPLDFSVIDTSGVAKGLYGKNWIASNAYSTVMAWATDTGKAVPKNWKEFFDPDFKGARSLYRQPFTTLELALMADAVLGNCEARLNCMVLLTSQLVTAYTLMFLLALAVNPALKLRLTALVPWPETIFTNAGTCQT